MTEALWLWMQPDPEENSGTRAAISFAASKDATWYHPEDSALLTRERALFLETVDVLVPEVVEELSATDVMSERMDVLEKHHLLEEWIAESARYVHRGAADEEGEPASRWGTDTREYLSSPRLPPADQRTLSPRHMWDPTRESAAAFTARVLALSPSFPRMELKAFIARVGRDLVARGFVRGQGARDRAAIRDARLPSNAGPEYEWLVRYQVLGETWVEIAGRAADSGRAEKQACADVLIDDGVTARRRAGRLIPASVRITATGLKARIGLPRRKRV